MSSGFPSSPVQSALLFHGLTSSPQEYERTVAVFREHGITVSNSNLPGHDGDFRLLRRTLLSTFVKHAEEALFAASPPTALVGSSFGALLAALLCKRYPDRISHLVLLSPPWRFKTLRNNFLGAFLSRLPESMINCLGTKQKSVRPEGALRMNPFTYSEHSLGAAARLWQLRNKLDVSSSASDVKTLVLSDPTDHHVAERAPFQIVSRLHLTNARIHLIPRGQHELLCGPEHERVAKMITDFIFTSASN